MATRARARVAAATDGATQELEARPEQQRPSHQFQQLGHVLNLPASDVRTAITSTTCCALAHMSA
jgi:hypothetical protein